MFYFYSLENVRKKFTFQIIQVKTQDFSQEERRLLGAEEWHTALFHCPRHLKGNGVCLPSPVCCPHLLTFCFGEGHNFPLLISLNMSFQHQYLFHFVLWLLIFLMLVGVKRFWMKRLCIELSQVISEIWFRIQTELCSFCPILILLFTSAGSLVYKLTTSLKLFHLLFCAAFHKEEQTSSTISDRKEATQNW